MKLEPWEIKALIRIILGLIVIVSGLTYAAIEILSKIF